MASDDSGDIFIKFRDENDYPIAGESQTVVSRSPLFAGFGPNLMFEIDSFTFAIGIRDKTEDASSGSSARDMSKSTAILIGNAIGGQAAGNAAGRAVQGSSNRQAQNDFKAFRTGRMTKPYDVTVQPVTVVRPIDKSSTVILQKCIDTETLSSATVVKRKAAGGAFAGEPFLRLDFVGVLIRDVSWSNEEPIKETMRFIARAITVRYRPQQPDGSLDEIQISHWSTRQLEGEAPLC